MFVYCAECEYWFENEHTNEFGQCRRKAPIPFVRFSDVFIGSYNSRTIWPYVRINDGCGEGSLGKRKKISELTKDQESKIETTRELTAFETAIKKARKGIS